MIACQKHMFGLTNDVTYLNCATMSPFLRSVERIGIEHLKRKSNPQHIESEHFFTDRKILKQRFAKLIDVPDPDSVSIIPSVSYGIATVAKNIPFKKGDEIVVLEDQFPSNIYPWKRVAFEKEVKIITVPAPPLYKGRGKEWNEKLMEAITERTKVVTIPHAHWSDGTLFNLRAIRQKTNETGAYLIIDGTQSIGAVPFSVSEIAPDAIICGGYKWLLGAYGLGMAYYNERFYDGVPIEDNWINHLGSEDFTSLAKYNPEFKPKSTRYDMGESSNFILVPMLAEGIRQLSDWTANGIQDYCKDITLQGINALRDHGYFVEEEEYRAHHLFGIFCTGKKSLSEVKEIMIRENIKVSFRGQSIRVSPHLYNTIADIEKLVNCFI
jgi:selenocysteine lyase/cysteine desulfurase